MSFTSYLRRQGSPSVVFLYLHPDMAFRQQFLYLLCPLREAVVSTIEVFLIADIIGFRQRLQTVEVEVIDRLALNKIIRSASVAYDFIFVHNGERRTTHIVLHPQCCTELFDECGLPHPHLAEEGEKALLTECLQQIPCHFWQLPYIANLYVNH